MSLNVTFTCNQVVDENNTPIDCKYQIYYPEHGIFNTVRDTSFYQYNANAGDADSLSQTGTFLTGEHAVIIFWQGDGLGGGLLATGPDRTGLKDRMSYHVITHDGLTNTYIIDAQLLPKLAPSCSWFFPATSTINRLKTAYSYASDDYSWSFNGITHYHHNKYAGTVIFDSIGNLTITYDFGTGLGFSPTNTFTYTTIGDYIAQHEALNQYSLSSICQSPIRISYNAPIGGISYTPTGVSPNEVIVGDVVTNLSTIQDEDSQVLSVDYRWIIKDRVNNTTVIRDTLAATSANIAYSYTSTLLELQDTFGHQTITWNDGWQNLTFTYEKELTVKNILPSVSISKLDLSGKDKRFNQVSSDIDGLIVGWTWKIFLLMPFSSVWTEVYSSIGDGTPIDITFNESGHYKVEITVQDDYGKYSTTNTSASGTAVAFTEFDITPTGTCTKPGAMDEEVYFIFPDVLGDGI